MKPRLILILCLSLIGSLFVYWIFSADILGIRRQQFIDKLEFQNAVIRQGLLEYYKDFGQYPETLDVLLEKKNPYHALDRQYFSHFKYESSKDSYQISLRLPGEARPLIEKGSKGEVQRIQEGKAK